MVEISDSALRHLRAIADRPELPDARFEVVRRLDQGGMASVYRVRDHELGRDIALKVLKSRHLGDEIRNRLIQEARIIAGLEHPGIVPVHDFGTLPDGRFYYMMKLVRGQRLDVFVRTCDSQARLLRIFERICDAVEFAHSKGVIHRDLKPQNVMIGPFGEVLVLDWGVAKLLPAAESLPSGVPGGSSEGTLDGVVVGTPGYMAPEQIRGEVSETDVRTDVYALGAILYFLLTGKHPEIRETRPSPSAPQARDIAPSIPGFPPKMHPGLAAICRKATAAAKVARYPSVAALSEDVSRFLSQLPLTAYPESVVSKVERLARKYRAAIMLVLAYLVMRAVFLLMGG